MLRGQFLKTCIGANFSVGVSPCLRSGGARFILAPRRKLYCRRKNLFKKLPSEASS
jgi:hypothetical protein